MYSTPPDRSTTYTGVGCGFPNAVEIGGKTVQLVMVRVTPVNPDLWKRAT